MQVFNTQVRPRKLHFSKIRISSEQLTISRLNILKNGGLGLKKLFRITIIQSKFNKTVVTVRTVLKLSSKDNIYTLC